MSSCYKCGKELPGSETECEYGCGEPAESCQSPSFMVGVRLDDDAVRADPKGFDTVLRKFLALLEQITYQSGLDKFAKQKPK